MAMMLSQYRGSVDTHCSVTTMLSKYRGHEDTHYSVATMLSQYRGHEDTHCGGGGGTNSLIQLGTPLS